MDVTGLCVGGNTLSKREGNQNDDSERNIQNFTRFTPNSSKVRRLETWDLHPNRRGGAAGGWARQAKNRSTTGTMVGYQQNMAIALQKVFFRKHLEHRTGVNTEPLLGHFDNQRVGNDRCSQRREVETFFGTSTVTVVDFLGERGQAERREEGLRGTAKGNEKLLPSRKGKSINSVGRADTVGTGGRLCGLVKEKRPWRGRTGHQKNPCE